MQGIFSQTKSTEPSGIRKGHLDFVLEFEPEFFKPGRPLFFNRAVRHQLQALLSAHTNVCPSCPNAPIPKDGPSMAATTAFHDDQELP